MSHGYSLAHVDPAMATPADMPQPQPQQETEPERSRPERVECVTKTVRKYSQGGEAVGPLRTEHALAQLVRIEEAFDVVIVNSGDEVALLHEGHRRRCLGALAVFVMLDVMVPIVCVCVFFFECSYMVKSFATTLPKKLLGCL